MLISGDNSDAGFTEGDPSYALELIGDDSYTYAYGMGAQKSGAWEKFAEIVKFSKIAGNPENE